MQPRHARKANRTFALILVLSFALTQVGTAARVVAQETTADSTVETQAETTPSTLPNPLVVFNVSGIERWLDDIDYMFETTERPELSDVIMAYLGEVDDLKGIDRDMPVGVMVFIKPGFPPQPVSIAYVPVESINDLLQTASQGPLTARKIAGQDQRFELEAIGQTYQVRVQHGYAFLGETAEMVERDFPNPREVYQQLTAKYDAAITVNLNSIPEGMKTVFLNYFRVSSEAELQRRNDEPESRHRLRKAQGLRMLEWMELFLTQGEDLTIGWTTSREKKHALLEVSVRATSDSKFARYLKDIGGKHSRFSKLMNDAAPLTALVSTQIDPAGKNVLSELLNLAESEMTAALAGENTDSENPENPPPESSSINRLFPPLNATVEHGHFDLFAQIGGSPPADMYLVGGLGMQQAETFAIALADILRLIENRPEVAALDLNVASHLGIAFHRLQGNQADESNTRMYGKNPGLYVGAGRKAIWFALGKERALDALKQSMDQVTQDNAKPRLKDPDAPFHLVSRMSSWLAITAANQETPEDDPASTQALARQAFTDEDDQLRVDFRPTETGARLRVEFHEGFIRFVGLAIARRFDRSQL